MCQPQLKEEISLSLSFFALLLFFIFANISAASLIHSALLLSLSVSIRSLLKTGTKTIWSDKGITSRKEEQEREFYRLCLSLRQQFLSFADIESAREDESGEEKRNEEEREGDSAFTLCSRRHLILSEREREEKQGGGREWVRGLIQFILRREITEGKQTNKQQNSRNRRCQCINLCIRCSGPISICAISAPYSALFKPTRENAH